MFILMIIIVLLLPARPAPSEHPGAAVRFPATDAQTAVLDTVRGVAPAPGVLTTTQRDIARTVAATAERTGLDCAAAIVTVWETGDFDPVTHPDQWVCLGEEDSPAVALIFALR